MKIDKKMIEHLEALARIDLTAEEKQRLAEQLDRIVGYIEQLQEVETDDVEATSFVVHSGQVRLRPDEPRKSLDREVILDQAPDAHDGFFRGPRIIER